MATGARSAMASRNYWKTTGYWIAVSLCLLSIGRTSTSLVSGPQADVHGGYTGMFNQSSPLDAARVVTASWYGTRHHNKRTASGQRFDMHKNTLAHKTLPLGTRVRLVNPDNGRSVEGVVNDRGPYIKGRDVDVSYAMAIQLGFVKKGVTRLDIEMI
ncbi:MAG: septal ring lytic transglycosylase RlpA family protein [Deltaproteobacteria bacterium]|nr:septal ring lytic transglycosylase RlpA family protein [Deltaproteobacteria bacterium]MBM4315326.1 septal ring lytic transglycosylase RlpA family protein [Deltaproteobacteria bacterium]